MLGRIKSELSQGRSLLQFGLLSAVGQTLAMVAPLVIAKCLAPAAFGSYSLAKTEMFFFLAMLLSAAQSPFIVFGSQERARTGCIAATFTVQCLWLVAGSVIFVVAAAVLAPWLTWYAQITAVELVCLGAAFLAAAVKFFLNSLAMALGQRLRNSVQELAWGVAMLGCVLALHAADRLNISTVFLTYPVALAPVLLVSLGCLRDPALRPWKLDRSHHREMFRFAAWISVGAVAVFIFGWGDNVVLRANGVSMRNIGVYSLASQIFKGIAMLVAILSMYFLPFVSEHIADAAKMRAYLNSKRPKIFLAALAPVAAMFAGGWALLHFYYGAAYAGAGTILLILLAAAVLLLHLAFYLPIFNAVRDYRFTTGVNIGAAVMVLVLNAALVPRWGGIGAAVAAVVAHASMVSAYEIRFRLTHKDRLGL
jgi:O-antigen/teichoic acid export membrane protein